MIIAPKTLNLQWEFINFLEGKIIMVKVLTKIFATPSKYVQGLGAINELGKHVKDLGKKSLYNGRSNSHFSY
jgi:hypothetical protein